MANVRCPMCSKSNPASAETCAYCGARLTPVSPPDVPAAGNEQGDEPEWLRSLRSESPTAQPGAEPDKSDSSEAEGEVPDWLDRIRGRAQTEPGDEEKDQEPEPDWLKGLQQPAASEEEGFSDWLDRFQNPSAAAPADAAPGAGEPDAGEEESSLGDDDWLHSLSQEPGPEEGGQFIPKEPSSESTGWPDSPGFWQAGEQTPETTGSQPDSGDFDFNDFLSSLGEKPAASDESSRDQDAFVPPWKDETERSVPVEDLPEWLGGPAMPAAPAQENPDLPDWMLESIQPEPGGAGTTPEDNLDRNTGDIAAFSEEETSDQLSWQPVSESAPLETDAPSLDLPDWMTEFSTEGAAGSAEEDADASLAGTGPFAMDDAVELNDSTRSGGEDTELQKWFNEISQAQQAAQETQAAPETRAAPETEPAASAEPPAVPVFADEESDFGKPTEDVPDWLSEFDSAPSDSGQIPPLMGSEAPLVSLPALEGDQPFAVDLPDWLSEDRAGPVESAEKQAAGPVEEDLPQTDLPDWVKEMRPIESIIPGSAQMPESDLQAERSGPLAGMSGILQAEDLAAGYRRPPVYSVKLRASEKQRVQASQFETILAQETQPLLLPSRKKRGRGMLSHMLVAILLLVGMALPIVFQMEPLALPALSPIETKNMFDQIDTGVSTGAPVLLAVDYEPALSGEMRLASLPVIEHLMAKNARLVIVSTRLTGPALAEDLLRSAAASQPAYDLENNTVNLGYLPGDMISLLEFARQPAFAAPADLNGELAWGGSTLQGIQSIRDFNSIIVLTDAAETGRIWVEQVQPLMGTVPLHMVTSAQASPLMAPFVESDQVNGMVSGLLGGYLYAQWAQQTGASAATYLASYQYGVLLVFVVGLLGSLVSGGIALVKRSDKEED